MQWYCNQWYVPWKDVDGTLFKNNDDDDDVSPLQPKALLTSELYWHLGKYFQFNWILTKHNYHQENDPHHHQDSDHQDDVVDQPGR